MSHLLSTYDGTSWHQGLALFCREGAAVRLHLTHSTIHGTIEKAGHDYLLLITDDDEQILIKVAVIEAVTRD